MQLTISNEAIAYQGKSPFAIAMTKLMQECIDHVRSITDLKERIAVAAELGEKIQTELPIIIKEHTGIIITYIVIHTKPCGDFGIRLNLWNTATIATAESRYTGYKSDKLRNWLLAKFSYEKVLTPDKLQKIVSQLDLETGKYITLDKKDIDPSSNLTHRFKASVSGVMYFDVYAAFLIQETYNQNLSPLIAEEIAAIVLHEVGHLISLIEHAAQKHLVFDMLYQVTIDAAKDIGRDKDSRVLVLKILKSLSSESKSEQRRVNTAIKVVETLDTIEAQYKNDKMAYLVALGDVLSLFVQYSGIVAFSSRTCLAFVIDSLYALMHTSTSIKSSDTVGTLTDAATIERLSDQYVSQHGYGSYQASALAKLYTADVFDSHITPSALRDNALVYGLFWGITVVRRMFRLSYMFGEKYEPMLDRARSLKRDILQNLQRSDTMSKEFVRDLINDYDRFEIVMNNSDSVTQSMLGAVDAFHGYIGNHLSPGALIAEFRNGNLVVEYTKLKNQVQSQIANPLYASAAKLDLLKR